MTGNPASGGTGGTASGGHFNYTGNSVAGVNIGAGAAGGGGTTKSSGGGGCGMTHWGLAANSSTSGGSGGAGVGGVVKGMNTGTVDDRGGGGCLGLSGWGQYTGALGELPTQMGLFVTSDIDGDFRWRCPNYVGTVTTPSAPIPFCGGAGTDNSVGRNGGIGAGGGGASSGSYNTAFFNGGFGAGGGASYGSSYPGAGGGIGATTNAGITPSFGGGAGYYNTPVSGGAACVVFIY
jgi:hypothetical protein